jgi:UDP-N-acetylmuramoyl-tripeptide--D-alanyl-D-alanine ligase
MLKRLIIRNLKWLAKLTLKRFKPEIIGVTGSAGKTSAKEAIYSVLNDFKPTRRNLGNFNTEIGLPLTILGSWTEKQLRPMSRKNKTKNKLLSDFSKTMLFLRVFLASFFRLIFPFRLNYPKILVLEYAADRPGDIKYLLEIARPKTGVVSTIGDIPVHVEFYQDINSVIREKSRLIEVLPAKGYAILNADDANALSMAEKTRAKIVTFGFSQNADVRITNFEIKLDEETNKPIGISFKLENKDSFIPIRILNTIGRPQAYAAAAAACVGICHGLNLVQIESGLSKYSPPESRLNILFGINNSTIIDDSYNSSPIATQSAIEAIASINAKRKIAILGDMKELGNYADKAHSKIGELAGNVFDVLIAVGPLSKIIASGAKTAGLSEENIFWVNSASEAISIAKENIQKDDLVLIKGSLSIGLKEVVLAVKSGN